jgi:hypothetical protein
VAKKHLKSCLMGCYSVHSVLKILRRVNVLILLGAWVTSRGWNNTFRMWYADRNEFFFIGDLDVK